MSAPSPPFRMDGSDVLLITESLNSPRSTFTTAGPAEQVAVIGFVCAHPDNAWTVGQLRSVTTVAPAAPGSTEILLPWSSVVCTNSVPPLTETPTSDVES